LFDSAVLGSLSGFAEEGEEDLELAGCEAFLRWAVAGGTEGEETSSGCFDSEAVNKRGALG